MPLGEFIAELGLQAVFEFVFYEFFYGTGYLVLKACTFGRIRLAPLATLSKPRGRQRRKVPPTTGKAVKAETVVWIGVLCWALAITGLYFGLRPAP